MILYFKRAPGAFHASVARGPFGPAVGVALPRQPRLRWVFSRVAVPAGCFGRGRIWSPNTLSLSLKENHQRESSFVFRRSAFLFFVFFCWPPLGGGRLSFLSLSPMNQCTHGLWSRLGTPRVPLVHLRLFHPKLTVVATPMLLV